MRGTEAEVRAFGEWLAEQPYEHKVLIAGNHDFLFEREPTLARSLLPVDATTSSSPRSPSAACDSAYSVRGGAAVGARGDRGRAALSSSP